MQDAHWQDSLAGESLILGRIAQSLDGQIATASGHSRWISGEPDIRHTHMLRAQCDAVLVGAGTVAADNPRLTTRLVEGPSPVRVILDPWLRLPADLLVFQGGPPTLLICADQTPRAPRGQADILPLPMDGKFIAPGTILAALAARGLRRVLVEGGGATVSRFLAAGCLDRLHVTIAPLLLGAGIAAFSLPGVPTPDHGRRLRWQVHALGDDVLLDVFLK